MPPAMRERSVPGVAIGVVHGERDLVRCFGVTDVEDPSQVDADTLFQTGSLTKTLTATLLAQLVEAGRLDLDTPLRRYLPGLELADAAATAALSCRHLLAHVSGFEGDHFRDTGGGEDALARWVDTLPEAPQLVPFDLLHSYSNAGYSLLGRVVEVLRERVFEDAARALVLDPLGMSRSCFADREPRASVAAGHVRQDGRPRRVRRWAHFRSTTPAAGLVSSVRELIGYARFHLAGDGAVLPLRSLQRMRQPLYPPAKSPSAMPWLPDRIGGLSLLVHGGSTVSQISVLAIAPEARLAFVALTNGDGGGRILAALREAIAEWLGADPPPPQAPVAVAPERLDEYGGLYRAAIYTIRAERTEASLTLEARRVGGVDMHQRPRPEALPPMPLDFVAEDRAVLRAGPFEGMPVWFARDAQGRVRWLKFYSRLTPRVSGP